MSKDRYLFFNLSINFNETYKRGLGITDITMACEISMFFLNFWELYGKIRNFPVSFVPGSVRCSSAMCLSYITLLKKSYPCVQAKTIGHIFYLNKTMLCFLKMLYGSFHFRFLVCASLKKTHTFLKDLCSSFCFSYATFKM